MSQYLVHIILCLCSWILTLFIIIPILLPIMAGLCLYRFIVKEIIYISGSIFKISPYTEIMSQVIGLDLGFANDEFWTCPKGAIGVVHVFNKPLNPSEIEFKLKTLLESKSNCLNYERLTSLIRNSYFGYSFWTKVTEFSLNNHINLVTTFDRTTNSITQAELNKIISNWNSTPFKIGCPLWDILIIPSYQIIGNSDDDNTVLEEQSIIGFRISHMIGDGYSIKEFMERLFNDDNRSLVLSQNVTSIIPAHTNTARVNQSVAQFLSTFKFKHVFNLPLIYFKFIHDFFIYRDSITTNPKINQIDPIFVHTTCSLKNIKLLKETAQELLLNNSNLTFGTLFLFLFGSALRKYLITQLGINEKDLPTYINVAASLPIQNEPHPVGIFCNHWTHAISKIPIAEPNSFQRLKLQVENYTFVINSRISQLHSWMSKYYYIIPNFICKSLSRLNIGTSIGFVNLPASGSIQFCGASLEQIIPIAGLQWKHTCLTLTVFSYNDNVTVSLLANRDFIPDSVQGDILLNKYFQEELKELCDELIKMKMGRTDSVMTEV